MSLYNFHRVLIGATILFNFLFIFWAIRQFRATDDIINLVMATGSLVISVAMVVYLVYFSRNLALTRHVLAKQGGGASHE